MYLHNLSVPAGLHYFLFASIHPQATLVSCSKHTFECTQSFWEKNNASK